MKVTIDFHGQAGKHTIHNPTTTTLGKKWICILNKNLSIIHPYFEEKENNNSMYSPEEQKYINKLISILRGNNDDKKIAVKTTLDALKRDIWDDSLRGGKRA